MNRPWSATRPRAHARRRTRRPVRRPRRASGRISISSAPDDYDFFSSWPPNSLRMAESSLSAKSSSSPRGEARVQRRREHRGRNADVDRGGGRPAALAGVGDATCEPLERRRVVQRLRGQVEEPGADDAAAPPDLRHLGRVDLVLVVLGVLERCGLGVHLSLALARIGVLDDVQALGVRGHEPVLDAVVDHLHEVAGAVRAAVVVPVLGLGSDRRFVRGFAARRRRRARPTRRSGSSRSTTSFSPPIIRQKPRSKPQTPPLVPTSTWWMPFSRSSSACRMSSW